MIVVQNIALQIDIFWYKMIECNSKHFKVSGSNKFHYSNDNIGEFYKGRLKFILILKKHLKGRLLSIVK